MARGNKKLKFFDRYIGIPLIFLLGLFKIKRTVLHKQPKTIAFLDTASIGDTILLFGIIKDVRIEYPNSKLIFFAGPNNYQITKLIPELDEVISLPITNPLKCIQLVRKEYLDIFIDFMSWPRINSLISNFAKAKTKIGFKTKNQFRHYVYDLVVDHSNDIHEVDNLRALIKSIGVNSERMPVIDVKTKLNPKRVVLHMFPSGYKSYLKDWPEDYWVAIAKYFLDLNFLVCITGGPSDRSRGDNFQSHFKECNNFSNYAGYLSLQETIDLLSEAFLVISVNTGIMHIAAALNRNLIALHGPTNAARWGPLNQNSISIKANYPGSPCLNLGFEYVCQREYCGCMKSISVQEVINATKSFLKTPEINTLQC